MKIFIFGNYQTITVEANNKMSHHWIFVEPAFQIPLSNINCCYGIQWKLVTLKWFDRQVYGAQIIRVSYHSIQSFQEFSMNSWYIWANLLLYSRKSIFSTRKNWKKMFLKAFDQILWWILSIIFELLLIFRPDSSKWHILTTLM